MTRCGAVIPTERRIGDGYATRLNPFVYFHSLLDLGDCDAKVGGIGGLQRDLASARATPAFSFVAPNLCNAGAEAPCADGSPGGLAAADAFLATWVPRILDSAAFGADDPYSLLRSVEDLFALRPLAAAAGARSFAPTVLGRAFVEAPSDG